MQFGERLRRERERRHLSQEALAEALGISARSINRWEQGKVVPQGQMRLQLSHFLGWRPEDFEETAVLKAAAPATTKAKATAAVAPEGQSVDRTPIWTLPFPRNPLFTGREDVLERVHRLLRVAQPVALTQASALTGLGGIGKTQVAIEYAYRYAREYTAVLWLAAETPESVMVSVRAIADLLQLPERHAEEQAQMVAAVQRWLMTHEGWLLIGDNVEEMDVLSLAFPALRQGTLLVTSRKQAPGPLVEPVEIMPMRSEEGMELVLRRARKVRAAMSVLDTHLVDQTGELVQLMDGLPLALDQAGAYIEETGCRIEDYIQRYQKQRRQILARRGNHDGAHPSSVATTLRLAIERVERVNPAAAALLQACAFLQAEHIPEEIFAIGAAYLGAVLGPAVTDPYRFDQILAELRGASLITRQPETRMLAVHRLVQAVLRDQMEESEASVWSERVMRMVNAAFPEPALEVWEQCECYLTHALGSMALSAEQAHEGPEAGELAYKVGSYLVDRGQWKEGGPLLERAIALGERAYGSEHEELIPRLMKRAELSWRQGKYELVEPLLQRVLHIGERVLEPDHPKIAATLNNLALLFQGQGKYELAEPLYQRVVTMQEQRPGTDPLEVATTLTNLGMLYRKQGKYELAEPCYQRALEIKEHLLGPNHLELSSTLNNLANLYQSQEQYERAESLLRRSVEIREQHLGAEHPDTIVTVNNLATLYRNQRKYELAELLYQRAMRAREQQPGPDSPELAFTLVGLGALYREQGRHELAELRLQQALDIREQRLGAEHLDTISVQNELALLYQQQGKYELAESFYRKALAIGERTWPEHPQTAKLRNDYGQLQKLRSLL